MEGTWFICRISSISVDIASATLTSLMSKCSEMLEVKPNSFVLELTPAMAYQGTTKRVEMLLLPKRGYF